MLGLPSSESHRSNSEVTDENNFFYIWKSWILRRSWNIYLLKKTIVTKQHKIEEVKETFLAGKHLL